jgi:hypothetical protein
VSRPVAGMKMEKEGSLSKLRNSTEVIEKPESAKAIALDAGGAAVAVPLMYPIYKKEEGCKLSCALLDKTRGGMIPKPY